MATIKRNLMKILNDLDIMDIETQEYGMMGYKATGYPMPENEHQEGVGTTEALEDLIKTVKEMRGLA